MTLRGLPMHTDAAEDLLSFRSIAQWVRAAAQCDIDLASLLDEIGLSGALKDPESSLVARHKIEQLMHRCIELARIRRPDRHFPLALAESFSFEYSSDLEAFIATAPTLRDAAAMLDCLPAFYDPRMRLSLSEFGSQARLAIGFTQDDAHITRNAPFVEMLTAVFARFARVLMGASQATGHISFRHQAHAHSEAYAHTLGIPVQHDQPLDAIWFDRSLLDRQLRGALPDIHQASATRLTHHTQALQRARMPTLPSGLAGQLTQALLTQPDWLLLDQEGIARQLNMSARTLQRRLGCEQTSYSAILDQVRHQLAAMWLRDKHLSIEDIGVRLGFSNRVGFTQAFNRWCGMTPAQYRQPGGG